MCYPSCVLVGRSLEHPIIGDYDSDLSDSFSSIQVSPVVKPLLEDQTEEGQCRRVCFDESSNVSHGSPCISPEEYAGLWCTPEDYRSYRRERSKATKEAIMMELEFREDPKSYQNVMERVYRIFCVAEEDNVSGLLDAIEECQFRWWISETVHNRLGLERTIASAVEFDKSYRRCELYETVLGIQENPRVPEDERAEMIGQVCHAISRPSRLFAAHLADALQHSLP